MAMERRNPEIPSIDQSMAQRIEYFYNRASILANNKFLVGLYGEYVKSALDKMYEYAQFTGDPTNKTTKLINDKQLYVTQLENFLADHANPKGDFREIELKWTAKGISIPNVKTTTETSLNIDAIKTLYYPLVKGHEATGKIVVNIVENRTMTMYHFFNALTNQFFNPKILKPRSSFQKLSMYVIVLNGEQYENVQDILSTTRYMDENVMSTTKWMENGVLKTQANKEQVLKTKTMVVGEETKRYIESIPLQVFEFNSIVPINISDISLSSAEPKKVEYTVTFEAPNLFQSSFNTLNEFAYLRDNSSDALICARNYGFNLDSDGGYLQRQDKISASNRSSSQSTISSFQKNLKMSADDIKNSTMKSTGLTVFEIDPSELKSLENGGEQP
jgi:hypothetical protein